MMRYQSKGRIKPSFVMRPERVDDHSAVDDVVRDAFGEGGSDVVGLVQRIRASDNYVPELALVAEDDSGVIGHTMLSWVGLEGASRDRLLNLTPRASALGFEAPRARIPDEAFMVKRLASYDPTIAGRIVYPAAFDALGD